MIEIIFLENPLIKHEQSELKNIFKKARKIVPNYSFQIQKCTKKLAQEISIGREKQNDILPCIALKNNGNWKIYKGDVRFPDLVDWIFKNSPPTVIPIKPLQYDFPKLLKPISQK